MRNLNNANPDFVIGGIYKRISDTNDERFFRYWVDTNSNTMREIKSFEYLCVDNPIKEEWIWVETKYEEYKNIRKCTKCNDFKDKEEFTKSLTKKQGIAFACKTCTRAVNKVSKQKHRQKYLSKYKENASNLTNAHINRHLNSHYKLKVNQISPELLEATKQSLKLKRFINEKGFKKSEKRKLENS